MALKTAMILTGISIGLLVIYGADVASGGGTGEGFLGSDHMTRGIGLGVPSIILPIVAFFISRKEYSRGLGIMLIISGALILIGGAVVLGMEPSTAMQESGRSVIAEAGPIVAVGAFIIALGAIKLKKLKNEMSLIHVFGVGITGGGGATLGAFVIYLIALKLGRTGLARYMKYAKINKERLSKADRWFEKYGDKSVLLGRLVPGLRELVSIPAGIFHMKPKKFLIFTFIGNIP